MYYSLDKKKKKRIVIKNSIFTKFYPNSFSETTHFDYRLNLCLLIYTHVLHCIIYLDWVILRIKWVDKTRRRKNNRTKKKRL